MLRPALLCLQHNNRTCVGVRAFFLNYRRDLGFRYPGAAADGMLPAAATTAAAAAAAAAGVAGGVAQLDVMAEERHARVAILQSEHRLILDQLRTGGAAGRATTAAGGAGPDRDNPRYGDDGEAGANAEVEGAQQPGRMRGVEAVSDVSGERHGGGAERSRLSARLGMPPPPSAAASSGGGGPSHHAMLSMAEWGRQALETQRDAQERAGVTVDLTTAA